MKKLKLVFALALTLCLDCKICIAQGTGNCDVGYSYHFNPYQNPNFGIIGPEGQNQIQSTIGNDKVNGYCIGIASNNSHTTSACDISICKANNFILIPGSVLNGNSASPSWFYSTSYPHNLNYDITASDGSSTITYTLAYNSSSVLLSSNNVFYYAALSFTTAPLNTLTGNITLTVTPMVPSPSEVDLPGTCSNPYNLIITAYDAVPAAITPSVQNICLPALGNATACVVFSTSITNQIIYTSYNSGSTSAPQPTNVALNTYTTEFDGFYYVPSGFLNSYTYCPAYSVAGLYTGTVTAAFNNFYTSSIAKCKTVYAFTVDVSPPIGAIAVSGNPQIICKGHSSTLTANAAGATNYTWMPGALTGTSIIVNPDITTTYTVIAGNAGCTSNPAVVTVSVGNCCLQPAKLKPVYNLSNVTIVAPGLSSQVWGNFTNGGTYSGAIALPSTPNYQITGSYNVLGSLTINTSVTFNNTNMSFDEAVLVTQNQPMNIYRSHWRGCEQMWNGIRSKNTLTINGSIIEDAANAVFIWVTNHPGATLTNNIFNLNMTSFNMPGVNFAVLGQIPKLTCAGNIFTSRLLSSTVYASAFNSSNVFVTSAAPNLATYPVNFIKGSPVMGIPQGIRSLSGMTFAGATNTQNIKVGQAFNNASVNAANKNYFDFVDYGIRTTNSRIFVQNAVFQNITGSGNLCGILHSGGLTEVGAAFGGTVNIYQVEFKNSNIGIFATTGGTVNAQYNVYTAVRRANDVERYLAPNGLVNINNNTLTNCIIDLYSFANSTNLKLGFERNTATAPNNFRHHVFINELSQATSAVYNINDNIFTGKNIGVFMQNVKNSFVKDNTIATGLLSNNQNLTYNCIELNNVGNSRITDNNLSCITGGVSSAINVTGINSAICVNNIYACNTIFNTGVCLKYQGPCPSNIWRNQLNANPSNPSKYGIWINNSGTTGNIGVAYTIPFWFNTFTYWGRGDNEFGDFDYGNAGFDTYASNAGGQGISVGSTIYWDGVSGSMLDPMQNGFSTQSIPYNKSFSPFAFPLPCGSFLNLTLNTLQANNQNIPPFFGNSLNFGSNTQPTLFNGRRVIFDLLKTQAISTSSLQGAQAFITANANSPLGSFFIMDSLVARQNTADVTNAKMQNTVYTANSVPEQTQKDYNSIYHNFALTASLTASEINNLTNLAQLCPFTDGLAVYQARALLTLYDSTEYSNPCEYTVGSGSGNRFRDGNSSINNDIAALNTLVYPNPASNVLNVSTEVEGAAITIYNILGVVVVSEKLSAITIINIDKLNTGTYLYKIVDASDNVIKTDKLIINK